MAGVVFYLQIWNFISYCLVQIFLHFIFIKRMPALALTLVLEPEHIVVAATGAIA